MKQRKQEPDRLYVQLEDNRGNFVELMNDGVLTATLGSVGEDNKQMLQTRAAFRGFVCSLTGLLGYTVVGGYGGWVDEDILLALDEKGGEV